MSTRVLLCFFYFMGFSTTAAEVCEPAFFVTERQEFSCECRSGNPSCELSWPGYSEGPVLKRTGVKRQENGTQFTCQMNCDGQVSTRTHTLKVAYGPGGLSIHGPPTFLADGMNTLTLTCEATEVNPPPVYSWKGVTCAQGNRAATCTFTPTHVHHGKTVTCKAVNIEMEPSTSVSAEYILDLQYPPPSPPKVTGYSPGVPVTPGDTMTCTVSGGKPPVSSVHFSCSNDTCPDQPDTREESSVSSSLVAANITDGHLTCLCFAVWEKEPALYSHSIQHIVHVRGADDQNQPGSEPSGKIAAGVIAVFVLIIAITVGVLVICKRRKGDNICSIPRSPSQSAGPSADLYEVVNIGENAPDVGSRFASQAVRGPVGNLYKQANNRFSGWYGVPTRTHETSEGNYPAATIKEQPGKGSQDDAAYDLLQHHRFKPKQQLV